METARPSAIEERIQRDALLTPEEVSAWLKVPRSWLYGRIHSKSLPFAMVKVGHYVRFPESSIQAYLDSQKNGNGKHD